MRKSTFRKKYFIWFNIRGYNGHVFFFFQKLHQN